MQCSVSGHPNPDDARFCARCGTRLPSSPDAPAPPTAPAAERDLSRYVPDALLRKMRAASAGGAMRGERRIVTMLFADLEGSTAAAEQLDPEDWADVVNGAFAQLIAPVYHYEGTLARLQGDAVLAFFGAPIAHEDDPVRAVHAGLDMVAALRGYAAEVRARVGVDIAVRVGINTGLVVVGEVGSDLRVEYTALGDAVNVAARMEQTADAGTVRITGETAALLGSAFDLHELGAVQVRGRSHPVSAFRVAGVLGATGVHASTLPMVGRDWELAVLVEGLDRLIAGVGGVVTIVGEAGIGKSRLLAGFRHAAGARGAVASSSGEDGQVAWLEGSSRSFDAGVPYALFRDVAARWLDLADFRGEETHRRISELVAEVLDPDDPDIAVYLANLVGAPLPEQGAGLVRALETPVLHERTTQAVVGYLAGEAARRPLVIVLNDLHWADAVSLVLAQQLADATEHAPILLVLALRPVRDEASWRLLETVTRELAHRHVAIELAALDPVAARRLLGLLLGDREVSAEDRQLLIERADGTPLFIEELARSLDDEGAAPLPTSLTGLLAARLDRLDEETRHVAEVAAVVGRDFDTSAVVALVDDLDVGPALLDLVRGGILSELGRLPRPRYAFRHALIQETAYDLVLLKDRRRLHGRLAVHLEQTEPDAIHEIARHHLASEHPDAAFPWLLTAADQATRAMSLAEAVRLFGLALDHVPDAADPDEVARAHLGLGEAYSLLPDLDHAAAVYQHLADLGRQLGRPALEARALNRLGFNAAVIGADFPQASRYLESARAVSEAAGDELGLAEYHLNACFVAVAQGEVHRAVEHDEATARLGASHGIEEMRVTGLVRRMMNLMVAAEFDGVEQDLEEAFAAAAAVDAQESLAILTAYGTARLRQRDGDLTGSLEALLGSRAALARFASFHAGLVEANAGRVALWLGDPDLAVGLLMDAMRTAERNGQAFVAGGVSATLALYAAVTGDPVASAAHRARARASLTMPVGDYLASSVWADLGLANVEQEAWEEAAADLTLGLEASSSTRFWERPRLLAASARVAGVQGDLRRADRLLAEATAHAETRGMRVFGPSLAHEAGRLAMAAGDLSGAEERLVTAEEGARSMGMRLLVVEVLADRAELADQRGRPAEVAAHRQRQREEVDLLAAGIADADVRRRVTARLYARALAADR